jgi:hypothetical protein
MPVGMALLATIPPEYLLFGGAAVVSLLAFTALILAPAVGSYGRGWEKATVVILSLFVLVALVAIGLAIGVTVVYFWDQIASVFT